MLEVRAKPLFTYLLDHHQVPSCIGCIVCFVGTWLVCVCHLQGRQVVMRSRVLGPCTAAARPGLVRARDRGANGKVLSLTHLCVCLE